MKVSDLLDSRRTNWQELEQLCRSMEGRSRRSVPAATATRFATLYRSACADLALADAYQLPPGTVQYLHRLVGRAHNQLYRSRSFDTAAWIDELFVHVPRRLFHDNCLRLAFFIFWGIFLASFAMAHDSPRFAAEILTEPMMSHLEDSFSQPVYEAGGGPRGFMAGFYIFHNAGIGLRCFAFGILFGVGGLFALVYNAAILGASFGFMAASEHSDHFFEFVTAHGPFELTAVVLSAGAGMRLGFSLVDTKGLTRLESLSRAGRETVPTMCAAIIMFVLAALIEGFLSPTAAPYALKVAVSVMSSGVLMFYFVILGYPRHMEEPVAERMDWSPDEDLAPREADVST